jgi:hypothetical protein
MHRGRAMIFSLVFFFCRAAERRRGKEKEGEAMRRGRAGGVRGLGERKRGVRVAFLPN